MGTRRTRGQDQTPRQAKRREGVRPEPPPTFDDVLLYERAEEAQKLIRSQQENVDPFELLAAVVWPSPEMLEAQIAARNAA